MTKTVKSLIWRAARNQLANSQKETEMKYGKLTVSYDHSIADLVNDGQYDRSNGDITDSNFPSDESGEKEVETALFHFNQSVSSEDAIERMKKDGCRPATMKELLSFGAQYPEIQREFLIVALGSVTPFGGDRDVGCRDRCGSSRGLLRAWFGIGWDAGCRFLAVRN